MIAYFDCFAGISGDMVLGAFADLGVEMKFLEEMLYKIPLTGFDITVKSVCRSGITAKNIYVNLTEKNNVSRTYSDIKLLIQKSGLSPFVKEKSLGIFKKIATAEAKIHDSSLEKVHFHEIGGIDSIVDITGTAICMEFLGIRKVISSKIPLGTGFVNCQHGTLPLPAPATISILKGVPVYGTEISNELTTPTGAAIISFFADSFGPIPDMLINKTGYGAGKREHKTYPNLLRIITGTATDDQQKYETDKITVIETAIDDMNPEFYGFLMDRLFENGAIDVALIPVYMKKNRPGTILQVLCPEELQTVVTDSILSETTSTGVRYYNVQRKKLPRRSVIVDTEFGKLKAKAITDINGVERIVPEYEICKKIALKKNIPVRVIYDAVKSNSLTG